MNIVWYISVAVFAASLVGLLFLIYKKLGRLSELPHQPRSNFSQLKKNQMIHVRFNRVWQEKLNRVSILFKPLSIKSQQLFHRVYSRVQELEGKHRSPIAQPVAVDGEKDKYQKTIWEAGELVNQNRFDEAEKKYIQVITWDHKNVQAYKGLAELYWLEKDYDLARSTFEHLLKLTHQDGEIYWKLGSLAMEQGDMEKGYERLNEAFEAAPNNPKYIDSLLEACILLGNKDFAWRLVARLKEANPENKKLSEFEDRIRKTA